MWRLARLVPILLNFTAADVFRFDWPHLCGQISPSTLSPSLAPLIAQIRRFHRGRDWPLDPPADHVEEADVTYHLGRSNLDEVDVRDVWP